jgi:hypothetical protein
MRLWQRLVLALAVAAVLFVPACSYLATHDLARTVRDVTSGGPVTWPPAAKRDRDGGGEDVTRELGRRVVGPAWIAGLVLLTMAGLFAAWRLTERRRRARDLVTCELRLSRDDPSSPYRVQQAFEAIAGAIAARWYERLWRGQDHFALETHRLPDGLICFALAAPRRPVPAIAGPLEDLYPDVRLIERSGRPGWAAAVVRLKKRRSHVLSLQTTRDYEHSFSESLAALMASLRRQQHRPAGALPRTGRGPPPGAAAAKAPRTPAQPRRPPRPARPRDRLRGRGQGAQGQLETQHRSLLYFDLRVAGEHAEAVAPTAGSFSQLRSENELVMRTMRLRRRLYARRLERALPNPLPLLRSGILSTSELATLWQLPGARAKLAPIARSPLRRAWRPPRSAAIRPAGWSSTSEDRWGSIPRTASTARR